MALQKNVCNVLILGLLSILQIFTYYKTCIDKLILITNILKPT